MDNTQFFKRFKTLEECEKEIEDRRKRMNECVGWLYRSILSDEIHDLRLRQIDIRQIGKEVDTAFSEKRQVTF